MQQARVPDDELDRLRKLAELDILDSFEEQAYDDLTRLAAEICQAPIALVSLIDRDRQWFKSHYGLDARETPREFAFCAHAILQDEVFVIEDSFKDERFHDNPLVTDAPNVEFYAGAPLIMSDKLKVGTLCVIGNEPRTITEGQKQALEALARQVVSQLELRLKCKQLEILDDAKDEFISMVSHELRTPLTAIYGSLSLLTNDQFGSLGGPHKNLADICYRNTERLLALVNDILDVAKLESGHLDLKQEPLDMVELVEKSMELNQQYCAMCGVSQEFNRPEGGEAIQVMADEQRLLQVMSNLISNAAKFSSGDDQIEIHLHSDESFAVVEVTDHGPGIPEAQQALLFKKFSQLDLKVNNKPPGTGLGLSISKKLIELHHGEIGCESTPDVRTTFRFSLPLDRSAG